MKKSVLSLYNVGGHGYNVKCISASHGISFVGADKLRRKQPNSVDVFTRDEAERLIKEWDNDPESAPAFEVKNENTGSTVAKPADGEPDEVDGDGDEGDGAEGDEGDGAEGDEGAADTTGGENQQLN